MVDGAVDNMRMNIKQPVTVFGGPFYDTLCETTRRENEERELAAMSVEKLGFARRVAHTDKKRRKKAFLYIHRWLHKHKSLTQYDSIPLWKAIFYAYWLCDKYHAQLKLAIDISQLTRWVHRRSYVPFTSAFYCALRIQWELLDVHRIDKYLMMCRIFIAESLARLHFNNWKPKLVSELVDLWLSDGPLIYLRQQGQPLDEIETTLRNPTGGNLTAIFYHFVNCFLAELREVIMHPADAFMVETRIPKLPSDAEVENDFTGRWTNPHIDEEELAAIRAMHSSRVTDGMSKTPKKVLNNQIGKEKDSTSNKLPREASDIILEPFFEASIYCSKDSIQRAIHEKIFRQIGDDIMPLEELAVRLFTIAVRKEIPEKRRKHFFETLDVIDKKLQINGRSVNYMSCIPPTGVDVSMITECDNPSTFDINSSDVKTPVKAKKKLVRRRPRVPSKAPKKRRRIK